MSGVRIVASLRVLPACQGKRGDADRALGPMPSVIFEAANAMGIACFVSQRAGAMIGPCALVRSKPNVTFGGKRSDTPAIANVRPRMTRARLAATHEVLPSKRISEVHEFLVSPS